MTESILGIISIILGFAGLVTFVLVWSVPVCLLAIILAIIGLKNTTTTKWSSFVGIFLAIIGIALCCYTFYFNHTDISVNNFATYLVEEAKRPLQGILSSDDTDEEKTSEQSEAFEYGSFSLSDEWFVEV